MIKLENVSKYYTSEDAVAIGMRRVSLELNIGEFVAVTGESGSGKSTFLNVISGIDSYEEGELTVNGEETSGYIQPDWEKFRNDYISFVFQEYNIIESYTVLQNVEIALINRFPDKKERRRQALDLIEKVGLSSHIKHKGTKLSGGQKQRVVIARALAKDSPVIMADEPTGNLDSVTGKEILALLAEMAKDRLIIVVTHNYEEVEPYATRKIRFFDGEVVEDRQVKPTETAKRAEVKRLPKLPPKKNVENILRISAANLLATPKKTTFLTALMVGLTIVLLLGSAIFGVINNNFRYDSYVGIFQGAVDNRLVIKKPDNTMLTAADKAKLNNVIGEDNLFYEDLLMDCSWSFSDYTPTSLYYNHFAWGSIMPMSTFNQTVMYGRAAESYDEVIIGSSYIYPNNIKVDAEGILSLTYVNQNNTNKRNFPQTVKCVGHTQIARGSSGFGRNDIIYVSDALYKDLTTMAVATTAKLTYTYDETNTEKYDFILYPDVDVPRGEALFVEGKDIEELAFDPATMVGDTELTFNSTVFSKSLSLNISQADENAYIKLEQNKHHLYNVEALLIVNPQDIYDVVYGDGYYQVSGFVDANKQNAVISRLENDGFYVLRTYLVNTDLDSENAVLNKIYSIGYAFGFLAICAIMYRLTFKVSGKVIKSKNHDYVIMCSIGIEQRITTRVLAVELCIVSLLSVVLLAIPVQIYKWTAPVSDTGLYELMHSLGFGSFMLAGISSLVISVLIAFKYGGDMYGDTIKNSLKSK